MFTSTDKRENCADFTMVVLMRARLLTRAHADEAGTGRRRPRGGVPATGRPPDTAGLARKGPVALPQPGFVRRSLDCHIPVAAFGPDVPISAAAVRSFEPAGIDVHLSSAPVCLPPPWRAHATESVTPSS
jgi:hypothetical protein